MNILRKIWSFVTIPVDAVRGVILLIDASRRGEFGEED